MNKIPNCINVLNHGYFKLHNISGPTRRSEEPFDASDIDPAQTARISFNNLNEERAREQDEKLLEYLIKNRHNSPIEMIEMWGELKVPIFIARQIHRHRTFTYNEISARYSILPAEWYIPEIVGGKPTNGAKQGQEDSLDKQTQAAFKSSLDRTCSDSYDNYLHYLSQGVAPEHARMFLHVNHFTTFIMKGNLHNWMNFLSLRLDAHAQIEARMYAQAIYDKLKQYLPKCMEFFDRYRTFPSQEEKDAVKHALNFYIETTPDFHNSSERLKLVRKALTRM